MSCISHFVISIRIYIGNVGAVFQSDCASACVWKFRYPGRVSLLLGNRSLRMMTTVKPAGPAFFWRKRNKYRIS